jgi:hypothetical protein
MPHRPVPPEICARRPPDWRSGARSEIARQTRNHTRFRYTAAHESLTVQASSLPSHSQSAYFVATVQKGFASTVAKPLIPEVENRVFACFTILCFWDARNGQSWLPQISVRDWMAWCKLMETQEASKIYMKSGT